MKLRDDTGIPTAFHCACTAVWVSRGGWSRVAHTTAPALALRGNTPAPLTEGPGVRSRREQRRASHPAAAATRTCGGRQPRTLTATTHQATPLKPDRRPAGGRISTSRQPPRMWSSAS